MKKMEQKARETMPPSNMEYEEIILGKILLDPSCYDQVRFLIPEDFYHNKHQVVFEAIQFLADRQEPINSLTLIDRIESRQVEDAFGDELPALYLTDLWGKTVTSHDITFFATKIKDLSTCRKILFALPSIALAAHQHDLEAAKTLLEEVSTGALAYGEESMLSPLSDLTPSYLERLDRMSQSRGILGVPTGLRDLDRLTGGLQKSDLLILAARPAVGKTSCALSIAKKAAAQGYGVAVFSLEMGKEQLVQRLLSMIAGIDQTRLRDGWIEDEEWERILEATTLMDSLPLYIDDTPAISCSEIQSKIKRLRASGARVDLVIVDYLQLMQMTPGQKKENRTQEVSEISRQLKMIARTLDIPVLALAQLSRGVESRQSKIPMLSDLRESGEIEQTADLVMFIYRDDVYNPESERANIADIIVAKHRNGPVGEISLYFQKSHTSFENLDQNLTETGEATGYQRQNNHFDQDRED